jgi:hypothetical protein
VHLVEGLIASYSPWKRPLPVVAQYVAAGAVAAAAVWGAVAGRFFQLRAAEWRFPAGAAQVPEPEWNCRPLFTVVI